MKRFNPPNIAPPAATYSHGIEISGQARWLYVAGQVGTRPDGVMPPDLEGQAEQTWRNVMAVLEHAGMGVENLVKVTSFLTRQEDVPAYAKVRDRFLGEFRPATTLLVIQGLARPGWFVEVEAIAARD
jgi:enamine deaminase RidA (YjgF/YER057c/UK114 family)